MVCLSGVNDSCAMLGLPMILPRSAPINFEVKAVNLDQQVPDFAEHILSESTEKWVQNIILSNETHTQWCAVRRLRVKNCGLCSRLRCATLYACAGEINATKINATKIALGHYKDDMVETLFVNTFDGARLAVMPPKLRSDDVRHIVRRPIAPACGRDSMAFAHLKEYPLLPLWFSRPFTATRH